MYNYYGPTGQLPDRHTIGQDIGRLSDHNYRGVCARKVENKDGNKEAIQGGYGTPAVTCVTPATQLAAEERHVFANNLFSSLVDSTERVTVGFF